MHDKRGLKHELLGTTFSIFDTRMPYCYEWQRLLHTS